MVQNLATSFFNFNKCEFLRITKKLSPITTTYNMESNIIKQVSSLGITINEHLQWSEHISNITNKANIALGFLHRYLKSCPPHIKISCYKSLIVPIIEYGSTVWDPYLHKDIEKIQRRAARFVKNDYSWDTSVTSLINLQWKTLQSRRTFLNLTIIYKIIHNLVSITSHYLIPNNSNRRHHNFTYNLPYSRINSHLHSFFPSSIRLWNSLDYKSVNKSSLQQFKTVLHNVL